MYIELYWANFITYKYPYAFCKTKMCLRNSIIFQIYRNLKLTVIFNLLKIKVLSFFNKLDSMVKVLQELNVIATDNQYFISKQDYCSSG